MPQPSPRSWDWEGARRQCVREARRILRSRAAAEDAAQEALARAWAKREACRDEASRGAWLAAIARNEALRLYSRESRRRDTLSLEDTKLHPKGVEETGHADRLALGVVLAALPPRDRELVRLRYVEDLTYTEVAKRLGIPEGTAKIRLHRLHKRLKPDLEGIYD